MTSLHSALVRLGFGGTCYLTAALTSSSLIAVPAIAQQISIAPSIYGISYPLAGTNGGLNQPGHKTVETVIAEAKALGANEVRVTVTSAVYDSVTDSTANSTKTAALQPSYAELVAYMKALKAAGFSVQVTPFALADGGAGFNALETKPQPTNFDAWIPDLTTRVLVIARAAQEAGADRFVLFSDDTENQARQPERAVAWVNYIAQIRQAFTGTVMSMPSVSGSIFDGANGQYQLFPAAIIDAVDVLSCACNPDDNITDSNNPTPLMLEQGLRGSYNGVDYVTLFEYIHRFYGKPLYMADGSFHSFDGANRKHGDIYNESIPLTPDNQEQADLFDASLATLHRLRQFDWYLGNNYSGQNSLPANASTARFLRSAVGENIAGKPAENIVRNWFTGVFPVAAQTSRSTSGNATGGDGDDVITLPATGTRTIDGGRGTNTLVLGMNLRDVNISGNFVSAQVTGGGVALTLTNIHYVQFNDTKVEMPVGKSTLSSVGGVQTVTGTSAREYIKTGLGDQTIVPGGNTDIILGNPWYRNTLRIPANRSATALGGNAERFMMTVNPSNAATRYWVRALAVNKIVYDDQEVTLTGATIVGTALQTHLYGSASNDTLTTARAGKAVSIAGSAGNDSIDGGGSTATVVYPERRANFTISLTNGVTTVVKPNGTDTLRNVAAIKFTDDTVSLTAPPAAARAFGPVFSSASTTSQSFIRVNNTGAVPGSVQAILRNPSSGEVLGSWTSPGIAPNSSAQFLINTIESAIPATVAKPATYAVNLQGALAGSTQHVLYRPTDGTLTNLTTCESGVTAAPRELINVHSSLLDYGFPSTVVIANTASAAAAAALGIYDSTSGAKLGTYTTAAVPANGELRLPIATIQNGISFTPDSTQYHYNIRIENAFTGFLQHQVNNLSVGVVTDMTTTCGINGTATGTLGAVPRLTSVFSSAQASSQSFLRIHNTSQVESNATLTLFDASSGAALAQWASPNVAPGASAQFLINVIENGASAQFTKPQFYAVQVATDLQGYMQHVLYRPADGTLTNLSTCDAGVTANPRELINVHSTILDYGFPSSVMLNNTAATAISSVKLGIYDSTNGTKLGTYTSGTVPANGQLSVATAAIEAATGINPGTTIFHYNVKVESDFTGFMQHLVNNINRGVITDMTTTCRLN